MKYIKKLRFVPRAIVDSDFRKEVIRRRIHFGLLQWLIRQPFSHIQTVTLKDKDNNIFTVNPRDKGAALALTVWGNLDLEHFHTTLALAEKEKLLKKNGKNIFVDAGGNIGTHTMYALRSGFFDKVIAIEPQAENYALLEQNIAANGFADQCTLFKCALGHEAGEVDFEVDDEHSGDHRVKVEGHANTKRNASGLKNEDERDVIKVPVRTLDDIMKECGIKNFENVFVGIDVQGYEAHILDGAKNMIRNGAVFAIEFWPYGLNYAGATEYLKTVIKENFAYYYDVRDGMKAKPIQAGDIAQTYERYTKLKFTDLLLVQAREKKPAKKKPPAKKSAKKPVKKKLPKKNAKKAA